MKKYMGITALVLSAITLLASCKDNSTAAENALIDGIINEISAENAAAVPQTAKQTTRPPETTTTSGTVASSVTATEQPSADYTADLDLTQMNATMIYSIIYDMMINPDNYYGKSIVVDGFFDTMYLDEFQSQYYFVVVPDATACCVQGLEFRLSDGKTYPDDYPEVRDDIQVKGVLDRYEEGGQTYAYIRADYVKVI